jgi:hypothetical protein
MYTEQIEMRRKTMVLLALPFAFTIAVLIGLIVILPIPLAGQLPIIGAMVIDAAVCVLLLASNSRLQIAIDDEAITLRFRILFRSRIPIRRIATCRPTDWRGWGIRYTNMGTKHRTLSDAKRGVRLTLTNKAEVLFTSRHPDAVCAALRDLRPEIALA